MADVIVGLIGCEGMERIYHTSGGLHGPSFLLEASRNVFAALNAEGSMSSSDLRRALGLGSGELSDEAAGDSLPSSWGVGGISSDFRIRSSSALTALGAKPSASLCIKAHLMLVSSNM